MILDMIKQYYAMGLYNNESLKTFVSAGMLTAQQYQEITGVAYNEAPTSTAPATSQASTATSQVSASSASSVTA